MTGERRPGQTEWRRWGVAVALNAVVVLCYFACSSLWVPFGGLRAWVVEYLLFLILLAAVVVPPLRTGMGAWALALAPSVLLVALLGSYDYAWMLLLRPLTPSDLWDVRGLTAVLPWHTSLAIALPIVGAFAALLWNWWRYLLRVSSRAQGFVRVLAVVMLAVAANSQTVSGGIWEQYREIPWSRVECLQTNGRLTSFIYFGEAQRRGRERLNQEVEHLRADAATHPSFAVGDESVSGGAAASDPTTDPVTVAAEGRNCHVIVLESWIDPTRCERITFSEDPYAPAFRELLGGQDLPVLRAPVYGGSTAQSEFELLCGAPALAMLGSIEFNQFTGDATYSLARALGERGYRSIATCACGPFFFNAPRAYQSLGFEEIHFRNWPDSYLRDESGDEWLFDGELFAQNRRYIAPLLEDGRPFFNYCIGTYGHFPFARDREGRPDRIVARSEDGSVDRLLSDIANQFWYRTQALAEHLNALQAMDPDSLIVVSSDHLPAIFADEDRYGYLGNDSEQRFMNVALCIDAGRLRPMEAETYHDLHRMLAVAMLGDSAATDELTGTPEARYWRIMASGMGLLGAPSATISQHLPDSSGALQQ